MKYIGLFFLTVMLIGCAQYDTGVALGKEKAAEVADRFVRGMEYGLCEAASIGAIKRKYGISRDTARKYNDLCGMSSGQGDVVGGN